MEKERKDREAAENRRRVEAEAAKQQLELGKTGQEQTLTNRGNNFTGDSSSLYMKIGAGVVLLAGVLYFVIPRGEPNRGNLVPIKTEETKSVDPYSNVAAELNLKNALIDAESNLKAQEWGDARAKIKTAMSNRTCSTKQYSLLKDAMANLNAQEYEEALTKVRYARVGY